MPGMGRGLQSSNSTVASAFHTALFHQLLLILVVAAVLAIAFNVIRTIQYRRLTAAGTTTFPSRPRWDHAEPPARRILRVGFGLLWVVDGFLQLQSSMPLGLPTSVIQPTASSSPAWVQHIVTSGVNIWSLHPVQAAAASVWIQIGLGLWLLVAPRGLWSRFGGLASVGWGLVVWVFGEAFGGIFAPGLTWLFGAPGAVLIYCVAGVLVALPDRRWATPRTGRIVLAASGVFFIAMAVLQAWPGRGYWQGRLSATNHVRHPGRHGGPDGPDAAAGLSRLVGVFLRPVRFGARMGRQPGGRDLRGWHWRRPLYRPPPCGAAGRDRGRCVLPGRLGPGGGSGIPRWKRHGPQQHGADRARPGRRLRRHGAAPAPVPINETAPAEAPSSAPAAAPERRRWWEWVTPGYLLRMFAALGAVVVVLVGTAPMTLAATNPNADPIISQALNGTPNIVDTPAPPFTLTNQRGAPVSLSSLRGHTIALTFLDPVCTSDCPLIAQEFRQADERLGSRSAKVDFVAIVANPIYRSISFTNAFDRQEGLAHMGNWLYLTGSLSQLRRVWNSYGVLVETAGAGAMIAHSDLAFVIDGRGHERAEMEDDPGAGGPQSSSFSSLLLARISAVDDA